MSGFSCPTCTTDNSRQDRQGVRTASQLEQKYNGVIDKLDLKVEGLSEQYAQITMDVGGINATVKGLENAQASLELSVNGLSVDLSSITGSVNSLAFTVNGLTITDNDGTTRIKGSHIDTSTIAAKSITADKLVLSGSVTFADLASGLQSTINSASSNASSAVSVANSANTKVNAWTYGSTTYIDGSMIMAGTVMAGYLQGGAIGVLGSNGYTYGTLYAGTNTAETTAFEVYGTNGLRLIASGNVFVQGSYGGSVTCASNGNVYLANGSETAYINVSNDGKISTPVAISVQSDRTKKNSITYDLEVYDAVFDALKPAFFRYNDGTSERWHGGFIAQDCEDAVLGAGLTSRDYAMYCKSPVYKLDENGDETNEIEGYDYSVRYTEIIPLNTYEIQKLKKRVAELEARIA